MGDSLMFVDDTPGTYHGQWTWLIGKSFDLGQEISIQ